MYLSIIIIMAILYRMAGGGFGADKIPKGFEWLPEAVLTFLFSLAMAVYVCSYLIFLWPLAYLGMQSGTWPILSWGEGPFNQKREATLLPAAKWVCNKLGIVRFSRKFCWVYLGIKGFILGLPLGGVPIAVSTPLAYEIGNRQTLFEDKTAVSEVLAGAFIGVVLSLLLLLLG